MSDIREVQAFAEKSADGLLWNLIVLCCPICFRIHEHGAGAHRIFPRS
jgi:hypothetical protein